MNKSFQRIFLVVFVIITILLVAIEWFVNQEIQCSHVIGWTFVAIFIAALMGILYKK